MKFVGEKEGMYKMDENGIAQEPDGMYAYTPEKTAYL